MRNIVRSLRKNDCEPRSERFDLLLLLATSVIHRVLGASLLVAKFRHLLDEQLLLAQQLVTEFPLSFELLLKRDDMLSERLNFRAPARVGVLRQRGRLGCGQQKRLVKSRSNRSSQKKRNLVYRSGVDRASPERRCAPTTSSVHLQNWPRKLSLASEPPSSTTFGFAAA